MENSMLAYIDMYPDQAQYKSGQTGNLIVELETREDKMLELVAKFYKLEQQVAEETVRISTEQGLRQTVRIPLFTEDTEWAGYGVQATVFAIKLPCQLPILRTILPIIGAGRPGMAFKRFSDG